MENNWVITSLFDRKVLHWWSEDEKDSFVMDFQTGKVLPIPQDLVLVYDKHWANARFHTLTPTAKLLPFLQLVESTFR